MPTDNESEEMQQLRKLAFNDTLMLESMTLIFDDGSCYCIDSPLLLEGIKKTLRKKFEENEAR